MYLALPDNAASECPVLGISVDVSRQRAAGEQAETARRELAEILDRVSDGIFALDADWRFRFINQAALAVSGTYGLPMVPEAFLGRSLWDAYPQILGTPLEEVYRTAMQDQVPVAIDLPPNPAGTTLNVRIYPSGDGLTVFYHGRSDSVAIQR
jgi:PAS domain-containing protein